MITAPSDVLSQEDYERFRALVYRQSGINLGPHKMQLLRTRLTKLMMRDGFQTFRQYYEHVSRDESGAALREMLDAISTHTTKLFREPRHFDFLRDWIDEHAGDPRWRAKHDSIRIWSAASSTGEEPYTIAMTALDALQRYPGLPVRILATDIAEKTVARAQQGIYAADAASHVPPPLRKYLDMITHEGRPAVRASDALRKTIRFAKFNLMTPQYPFKRGFDIIFCRNVMIYFDKPTQQQVVSRLSSVLAPGGYLLIGHSESLHGIEQRLRYVQPTIYQLGG